MSLKGKDAQDALQVTICVCSAAKRSRIRRERLEPRTFASFKDCFTVSLLV